MLSAHEFSARWQRNAVPRGHLAVLFDHDHTAPTYAIALALAETHERVVLLTPRTEIAQAVNYCSAIGIHRRLHRAGVEIVVASKPTACRDGTLTYVNVFNGRERTLEPVDVFVYATPRRVVDGLATAIQGVPVHRIGDCMAPRNMMIAIHEGHAIGMRL